MPICCKNFIINFLLIIVCSSSLYSSEIRVLSYNLWGGKNATRPWGYDSLAAMVELVDPDVAGLQEVDSANKRSKGVYVAGYMAEKTDMYSYFARGIIGYQGGQFGEAMISDEPAIKQRKFWMELPGAQVDRGAIEINITVNGERVRILSCHQSSTSGSERVHQAEVMSAWIDSVDDKDIPMILMGDFNATQDAPSMKIYKDKGFEFVTNSSGNAISFIDHILFRPAKRWKVIKYGLEFSDASDHPAVWADLELLDKQGVETTKPLIIKETTNTSSPLISTKACNSSLYQKSSYTVSGRRIENSIGQNVIIPRIYLPQKNE